MLFRVGFASAWAATLVFIANVEASALAEIGACRGLCQCFGSTVVCRGLGLEQVPTGIPVNTTILDLANNNLKVISPDIAATRLHLPQLQGLYLGSNQLTSVPRMFTGIMRHGTTTPPPPPPSAEMLARARIESLQGQSAVRSGSQANGDVDTSAHTNTEEAKAAASAHLASHGIVVTIIRSASGGVSTVISTTEPSELLHLSLENNQFETLPSDMLDHSTKLRTLLLANNTLTAIPQGLFSGPRTKLTSITLEDNKLTLLPVGAFAGLARMTSLNLRKNELTELNDDTFYDMFTLEELDISDNLLVSLPGECDYLVHVHIDLANLARCQVGRKISISSIHECHGIAE
jgi:Leucine-rich repeat (LRR) protein